MSVFFIQGVIDQRALHEFTGKIQTLAGDFDEILTTVILKWI